MVRSLTLDVMTVVAWIGMLILLVTQPIYEESERSGEFIEADEKTRCLNASHTEYDMVCYDLDGVNL